MSWLGKLVGGGVAPTIEAAGNALDKIFTSDGERLDKQAVLEKIRQEPHILYLMTNMEEAKHRTVFVAGWRPAIGWVAAASLASYYIPQFVVATFMWVMMITAQLDNCAAVDQAIRITCYSNLPDYPVSGNGLMELVIALLGLAGLRTYEKHDGKVK